MKSSVFKIISYIISIYVSLILSIRRSKCGCKNRIALSAMIFDSTVGNYCYIGPGCIFNKVIIGNYCSFAPYVSIGGMEHSYRWGSTSTFVSDTCIDNLITYISDDVWIGTGAIIKQGVKIGRGAVVGAGALVLADVNSYSIVAGVPAKEIKMRFSEDIINQLEESKYWNYEPKIAKNILNEINYEG